jgi:ribose-phosphate pyrophosphokinase
MDVLRPALFALSESRYIAESLARNAGVTVGSLEDRRFEDGEFKLRPLESVRGRSAFVLQTLAGTVGASASDRLVRLLFLLNVLRDGGASRRIALVPYLAFARKERRTQSRDPVNTRYVAQLLETSGADQLIALDVHNPAALDNAFRIPVDHLTALPMMVDHFATRHAATKLAAVSPDIGGIKRVQIFRELLETRLGREVEHAFIEKRRAQGVVSTGMLVGDVIGREVIVLDDLCATGGTLIRAAQICRRAGATGVHAAVTHMLSASGLDALLKSDDITQIVTTDSVDISPGLPNTSAYPDRLVTLSIAPLFGQAVRRMLAGKPMIPLLTRWPVALED